MELAIDTSTNTASIALSQQGKVTGDVSWHTRQNHTVELIPRLISLLERNNADIHDIKALSVAKGPGSFNGLRVGLATTKGLAFALDIPLVSIGTLEIIAYPYAASGLPVCPILQVGRSEVAAALFRKDSNQWTKPVPEYVTNIDDICATTEEKTLFCGEITTEQTAQLKQSLGNLARFPTEDTEWSRAGYLAELGWCKIETDHYETLSTLQPMYLKKPSITKPKRRKHDALSNMRP
jgi:tRNA threonylcarbamoyladenosine biosynthesis protein TsaB